jgi:hypothetical protein
MPHFSEQFYNLFLPLPFNISGAISSQPAAFPFFILFKVSLTSLSFIVHNISLFASSGLSVSKTLVSSPSGQNFYS